MNFAIEMIVEKEAFCSHNLPFTTDDWPQLVEILGILSIFELNQI